MEQIFTNIDIIKILGVNKQRLRGWQVDIPNFFKPSIQEAGGSGRKALYSLKDVFSFALFKTFIEDCNIDRKTASIFVRAFRNNVDQGDFELIDYVVISNYKTSLDDFNKQEIHNVILFKKGDPGLAEDHIKLGLFGIFNNKDFPNSLLKEENIKGLCDNEVALPFVSAQVVNFKLINRVVQKAIQKLPK